MTRSDPDVSIVIPTYNANESLVRAINSIVNQENVSAEIIVIEDGSEAASKDLIEQYFKLDETHHAAQIKYLKQTNQGAYRARLNAASTATGRSIKFLDQDDILLPGSLAQEVDILNSSPETDVVITNWQIAEVDGTGETIGRVKRVKAPNYTSESPIDDLLSVGGVFTSAALYRRSTTAQALEPIDTVNPVKADDWLIFAQVCVTEPRYEYLDIESYQWNSHANQLSDLTVNLIPREHYAILSWIESVLFERKILTENRKHLLANYYAKQLLTAIRNDSSSFKLLVHKIGSLDPHYVMQHGNFFYRKVCTILGYDLGSRFYAKLAFALGRG